MSNVTLKDIAKLANISPAAVSIILNDKPSRISETKKQEVKKIAKELKKKYNVDIDRKKIIVENAIKMVGEYVVTVKLDQGVIADLKVDIIGE